PGVKESIERFEPLYKLGIVSGSSLYGVQSVIRRLGVEGVFDPIVSFGDYKQYKPHPEPYLLALQKSGETPGESVAFEDTESGIISAHGAHIPVIGATIGSRGRQDLSDDNRIVETLDDVTVDLIESLN
ncbi:MAG: HAD family hydrolase, partial [Candidatus Aenigmatarchaeota archaeon]